MMNNHPDTPSRPFVMLSVAKDLWLWHKVLRLRFGTKANGFTLIELSIVLVIIGLVVGGVLVGRDLIKAAEIRAEITQIEKFNQATNTFYGKYGYLPGDIPAAPASQFGFAPRGNYPGQGDGNGLIQGTGGGGTTGVGSGWVEGGGETALFWVDLSAAKLIDGGFSTASASLGSSDITGTGISLYLPQAKIGSNDYVYVWNTTSTTISSVSNYSPNYFGIASITAIQNASNGGKVISTPNISVIQAYTIDKKIDDGLPFTGTVQAVGLYLDPVFGIGTTPWGSYDALYSLPPTDRNFFASSVSCVDNAGSSSNTIQYSISYNNGSGPNCVLSFKFN